MSEVDLDVVMPYAALSGQVFYFNVEGARRRLRCFFLSSRCRSQLRIEPQCVVIICFEPLEAFDGVVDFKLHFAASESCLLAEGLNIASPDGMMGPSEHKFIPLML